MENTKERSEVPMADEMEAWGGSYLSVPYGISGIQTAGEGKIQRKIKGRERKKKRERKGTSVG